MELLLCARSAFLLLLSLFQLLQDVDRMDSSTASEIAQDVIGSLEQLWKLEGEVDEETLRQAVGCVRAARNAASEAEHQQVIL